MQKIKLFLIRNYSFLLVLVLFIMPAVSFATVLVPCTDGKSCDFNALMTMVNTVIKFIIFDLALPIDAIMFVYAGFKLVTSGGDTGARQTAKDVFTNTLIGLIFAVAAWLIINTVLSILGYQGSWIGFVKPTP